MKNVELAKKRIVREIAKKKEKRYRN